jgi:hypothetical protein
MHLNLGGGQRWSIRQKGVDHLSSCNIVGPTISHEHVVQGFDVLDESTKSRPSRGPTSGWARVIPLGHMYCVYTAFRCDYNQ